MSFKKIIEIKKLGIFEDYSWKCSEDFKKHNILFGFNGSGKSTLSNLFNLMSRKDNYSTEKKAELYEDLKRADNATVKIAHSNNETLTYPPTANHNNKNIYVFNSNFIADHVFDGQHGRIQKFNVAETVLEDPEIKKLDMGISVKTKEKEVDESSQKAIADKFKEIKQSYNIKFIDDFPRKSLRQNNFPTIAELPSESKSELEKEIKQKVAEFKLSEKQDELEADIEQIEALQFKQLSFDFDKFAELLNSTAKEKATNNLKTKIENLQTLVEEDGKSKDVEPWYKLGQRLLEKSKTEEETKCPLCDSDLTLSIDHLLEDFSEYFDKSYEEFTKRIKDQETIIETDENQLITNKDAKTTIQELGNKYEKFLIEKFPSLLEQSISDNIKTLKRLLNEKQGNSGKKIEFDFTTIRENVRKYNGDIEKLISFKTNAAIALKNQKIDPASVEDAIRKLYAKLVCIDLNSGGENNIQKYHELTIAIAIQGQSINELIDEKIQHLKDLKMEAKKVGEYLVRLGINHFTIDLNEENEMENILIKYKDDERIKKRLRNTLSEGEKTALAFAYFLSKVTTEVKGPKSAIIIIDDPISSLDDNRLYHTAYMIHDAFKEYKQLFVLSHNLLFLKYLNPLFKPASKTCYIVNAGVIDDLPKSLQNFQSPYFYMLESLMTFNDNETPDYEEARKYLPNYIRRILETFFSFRYAQLTRDRNKNQSPGLDDFITDFIDFNSLPELTIGTTMKTNIKDRLSHINKICDNFSHGNTQQLDECNFIPDDTLKKITTETLEILGYFDGLHFQKVEELIGTTTSTITSEATN